MPSISLIDKKDWEETLNIFSADLSDIYFTPDYTLLYESGTKEGKVKCLKFENDYGIVLYPYIERKIPLEVTNGVDLIDIATPYGYGGPISTTNNPSFLREFNKFADSFFLDMKYVAEFIRYHPIIENYKFRNIENIWVHNTFGVNFSEGFDEKPHFWKDSSKRNVKKSQKFGLSFNIQTIEDVNLDKFIKLYMSTMKRKNALDYYFFNSNYWNLLIKLSKNSKVLMASVSYRDKTIASAILLNWKKTYLHYHLGGSDNNYFNMRPNNYLFWEIEKWAAKEGFSIMHLGGGVIKGDTLERFKRSISNVEFKFFIGRKVFNSSIFRKLNKNAERLNKEKFDLDYFPPYRSIFR